MIVKDRKLYCKVIEAKNLYNEKTRHADTYCLISIENGETRRTPTVCNESDPFFGEELIFEENLPATLRKVTLNVYNALGAGATTGSVSSVDKLLGRASFPREWLEDGSVEEEQPFCPQWFVLMPPEPDSVVNGEVRLSVELRTEGGQKAYVVTIFAARDLSYLSPGVDPFLVLHLIPDPTALTTQRTQCIKETTSPIFNETFTFPITDIHPSQQLHVSMWDAAHQNAFLGHFTVDVTSVEPNVEGWPRWRSLLPKPRHMYTSKMTAAQKRASKGAEISNNTQKAKLFVQDMQSTVPVFADIAEAF
ncbi:Ras GTPase-activating protein 4 [Rhizophlyctis rosea]|nr:Ras GTPase-activating protein 4 [Rhizophlyctis rosea]